MTARAIELSPLAAPLAVARLPADAPLPEWSRQGDFLTITRSAAELSIVCAATVVPAKVEHAGPFAGFYVHGPLDFTEVGILAALTRPLAEARISVFAISSYDTDTLLVPLDQAEAARACWRAAGFEVH